MDSKIPEEESTCNVTKSDPPNLNDQLALVIYHDPDKVSDIFESKGTKEHVDLSKSE